MRQFSLRFKILAGLALISSGAMAALIAVLHSYLATTLESQLVTRGEFIARSLAEHCVDPILLRQGLSLDLMLHESKKNDVDVAYVFILDPGRMPISHTFDSGFPVGLKELNGFDNKESLITTVRLGDEDIIDISVPVLDGRIGRLHVGMTHLFIQKKIAAMLFNVLCVIVVLLLAAAVAMWLFLERVTLRPIRELADKVSLLGRGQFEAHAKVQSRDELGALGRALNDMGRQLRTLYEEISDRNRELSHLNERLEQLATTDGLTGLFNHRHFYERLGEEVRRSKRYRHPLSLIMGDLDRFKRYNDTLGHVAGDKVLKLVAELIGENARENDLVARYGGEEFAIVLPETPLETARLVAERMRSIIETSPALQAVAISPSEPITVSFGVAVLDDATESPKGFVYLADAMLYRAKQNGRNRVEC